MNKSILHYSLVVFMGGILLCCFCQKKSEEGKFFAKVGWKVISQESFDGFKKMKRLYPSSLHDNVYPGRRSNASQCVETEAIYRKAKSQVADEIKKSIDWKWKEKFYTAQMYLIDVLDRNWGFLDNKVEKYYNDHKEEYKKVIKVSIVKDSTEKGSTSSDSTVSDSTKKAATKDSVIYRPVNAVRAEIARKLFLAENPPTAEFFNSNADTTDSGKVVIDTAKVEDQWTRKIRRNLPEFFMKKFYKKRYGHEYPDSLNEIFGEGKIITPEDRDMILYWIPKRNRKDYNDPEKQKYLIGWLLKWKLFHEEATNTGFAENKDVKEVYDWAWKYEVAVGYINGPVVEKNLENMDIDTSMCVYEHWDRTGRPDVFPDSAALANIIQSNITSKKQVAVDKAVYNLREKADITFLQSDFVDEKNSDPDKLAAEADSLYGAGESKEAEKKYKKLVDNFPFTPRGLNALVELAKILTEKEKYHDAIKNYRRYLLFSSNTEKRCNIFFMIGFVYGEYLNKPVLAEASYKWILKNTPECELSDDAEFMCLHLDEPMIGVDELQAEATRQGRKIDDSAEPVSEVEVKKGDKASEG